MDAFSFFFFMRLSLSLSLSCLLALFLLIRFHATIFRMVKLIVSCRLPLFFSSDAFLKLFWLKRLHKDHWIGRLIILIEASNKVYNETYHIAKDEKKNEDMKLLASFDCILVTYLSFSFAYPTFTIRQLFLLLNIFNHNHKLSNTFRVENFKRDFSSPPKKCEIFFFFRYQTLIVKVCFILLILSLPFQMEFFSFSQILLFMLLYGLEFVL